jgi:hypothetical protein
MKIGDWKPVFGTGNEDLVNEDWGLKTCDEDEDLKGFQGENLGGKQLSTRARTE